MTEFRNSNGNVLIITEINGRLIASYNGIERFELDGFNLVPTEPEWIEWNGGKCPVDSDERVEIKRRDGVTNVGTARWYYWKHSDQFDISKHEIIAYRIVPTPPAEPAEQEHDWQEWTGGENPFLKDEKIAVKLRYGRVIQGNASGFEWQHEKIPDDIVAFKRL